MKTQKRKKELVGCSGCIAKNKMFREITSKSGSICAMISFLKKEEIKTIIGWAYRCLAKIEKEKTK
jgi:hypothetical protein